MTWEMDLKIIQEDAEKKGEKKGRLAGTDSEIAEVTALPLREVAML